MKGARSFIGATRELAGALDRLRFGPPVGYVYNPLNYARAAHEEYLRRYLRAGQRVVFLGMNPGPFGMAQCGVPFGEVGLVRTWLGIDAPVGRPAKEHPRRPVLGFDCPRSEVSGRRLWGLFKDRFGTPARFFSDHFVYNYCPLLFIDGGPGARNLTPETLSGDAIRVMQEHCDRHLMRLLETCGAERAIGVGKFAERRLQCVAGGGGIRVAGIPHPSPANPAANRDWAGAATRALGMIGVWQGVAPGGETMCNRPASE